MNLNDPEVVSSIESLQTNDPPGELTLSSGVRLKIRRVPPLLMRRAQTQLRPPKVPLVFDRDRDREIENPNDPEYLNELASFGERQNLAVIAVLIVTGSSLLSTPDDIPALDSDEWIETLNELGVEVKSESKVARYLSWIENVAITDPNDLPRLGAAIARLSGVMEADVADAMESFRSDTSGPVSPGAELSASNSNGHSLSSVSSGDNIRD